MSEPFSPGMILLGLGPGHPDLLTRQAWSILHSSSEIWARTRQHPALETLPSSVTIHSFDSLYGIDEDHDVIVDRMVEQVLLLGHRPQGVVYAVPGHPLVGESAVPEIVRRARADGLPVKIVDGLSFLEPACSALGIEILPHTALVDALALSVVHIPPFPTSAPALIAHVATRVVAGAVMNTLQALYPETHPVKYLHSPGTPQERVESLTLGEIERSPFTGPLSLLWIPPLGPETALENFAEVIARLRAPDGCPWDREQTHQTLRASLLEETYEVLAALDADDPQAMEEEFGDLLMQIVMHAQIASEAGEFNLAGVIRGIHTKIVRRHPHVFGELEVRDAQGVLKNWEKLKAEERAAKNQTEKGLLDGVSLALPALVQAEQYQGRAARVGFDWPDIHGVIEKMEEEIGEVHAAETNDERAAEIGDLLFAVVNLARWHKIDPESALREANARFRRRFGYIEQTARAQGRTLSEMTLDEMEDLWQEAKKL